MKLQRILFVFISLVIVLTAVLLILGDKDVQASPLVQGPLWEQKCIGGYVSIVPYDEHIVTVQCWVNVPVVDR